MSGDELRALAEAATPGPWEDVRVPFRDTASYSLKRGDHVLALIGWEREEPERAPADAAFIAAANPTAVLGLLDEGAALRAQVERVRALADEWDRRALPISAEFENATNELRAALDQP